MRLGTQYRYELLKNLGIFNKINKNSKVLDIGGFDGFTLSTLKASKKVLIDPDANKLFINVKYIKKDFFSHNFKDQKFDFIFSFDVLEHIPEEKEEEYFKKILSLLNKNGMAYITTPSINIQLFPKFLTNYISKKWGHYKFNGYSKEDLKNFLTTTKIRNYEILSYHSRYYLNSYLLVRLLKNILPKKVLKKIVLKISEKDSILDKKQSKGYYLIKIRK